MPLVDNPNETLYCDVDRCGDCGADLTGAPVGRVERRQVTDIAAPPPPYVTEYRIITRTCPCCAAAQAGAAPRRGWRPAPSTGPRVLAAAAELTCAHYLPVGRAAALMATLAGIGVSVGFVAGVRGRAARLLEAAFLPRVRELLGRVGVLHVDETPARADKSLGYVHVAATEWLTAMHTGGRSKADIDNGGILPGYAGTIVRDGYAGYTHLTDALHAWCGAHLLRDLAAFHRADPDRQVWAKAMADLLIDAHHHAQAARAAGAEHLDEQTADRPAAALPGRLHRRHPRQPQPRRTPGPRRRHAGPALPRPPGHDPALRGRPRRALHQQPGRTRPAPGQDPTTHLRRHLAHPGRPGRLRRRPVLPVHRPQMGNRQLSTPSPDCSPPAPGYHPPPHPAE